MVRCDWRGGGNWSYLHQNDVHIFGNPSPSSCFQPFLYPSWLPEIPPSFQTTGFPSGLAFYRVTALPGWGISLLDLTQLEPAQVVNIYKEKTISAFAAVSSWRPEVAQLPLEPVPTPTPIPSEVRWPDVVYLPVIPTAMKRLHSHVKARIQRHVPAVSEGYYRPFPIQSPPQGRPSMRRCTDNKRASMSILLLHHPPTSTATPASIHLWIYGPKIAPFFWCVCVCVPEVKLQLYARIPFKCHHWLQPPPINKGAICEAQVGVCSGDTEDGIWWYKAAAWCRHPFLFLPPWADCWWNSCLLRRAECRVEEGKKMKGYKAPLHSQPPLLLLFSPLLLPLPPLPTSLIALQREGITWNISLHILLRGLSPVDLESCWIHRQP